MRGLHSHNFGPVICPPIRGPSCCHPVSPHCWHFNGSLWPLQLWFKYTIYLGLSLHLTTITMIMRTYLRLVLVWKKDFKLHRTNLEIKVCHCSSETYELHLLLLQHTRINRHAVERIHGWLRTRQVPYSLVQYWIFARPLLRRPKRLKDIVATQTRLHHPQDARAWEDVKRTTPLT